MTDDSLDKWIAAFPVTSGIPFLLKPPALYSVVDLYDTYKPDVPGSWVGTYDQRSYVWFIDTSTDTPRKLSLAEAIAARLHDATIETAIDDFLTRSPNKIVGFMGGHDTSRRDPSYRQIASIARSLRRDGIQIVSGGGPV